MFRMLLSSALIPLALAQSGPQAALIPPCVVMHSSTINIGLKDRSLIWSQKTCDPLAIASVNCTGPDQLCHCRRQAGILSNITTCADLTCSNPSADMYSKYEDGISEIWIGL